MPCTTTSPIFRIFMTFHHSAYRRITHAEVLGDCRHRVLARQVRLPHRFVARVAPLENPPEAESVRAVGHAGFHQATASSPFAPASLSQRLPSPGKSAPEAASTHSAAARLRARTVRTCGSRWHAAARIAPAPNPSAATRARRPGRRWQGNCSMARFRAARPSRRAADQHNVSHQFKRVVSSQWPMLGFHN